MRASTQTGPLDEVPDRVLAFKHDTFGLFLAVTVNKWTMGHR